MPAAPKPRLDDLEASGVYVAGFLESSGVRGRSDLFDLLVDISAREVVVADHAREVNQCCFQFHSTDLVFFVCNYHTSPCLCLGIPELSNE